MPIDLEPRRIQSILILLPPNVVYEHLPSLGRLLLERLRLTYIGRWRQIAIAGIFVVIEGGKHITGLTSFRGRLDFMVVGIA